MEAQRLYGLPLDRFVAERRALAKALRSEGRREEAADVASLHKPSVAAWAVNQLVRTQRRDISGLFDAGDELQRAQSELLAGRTDPGTVRAVVERERAAVEVLIAAARGLLSTDGHEPSATTLERVADTLHAAALDPDARAQVRDGCLVGELRHVGFGAQSPGETPGSSRRESRSTAGDRRAAELKAARKAEVDARRVAEQAARQLQAAQEKRDRAASALRDADTALDAAREQANQAADAHRQAREAAERFANSPRP